MKKEFTFFTLFILLGTCFAQEIPRRDIEDSVIGWMKIYNFKGTKEPKKVEDKIYSVAQLSISDSFANWMQASYTPIGGLGDVRKTVSGKIGLYNKYEASLPQSYGAIARTYLFLKYNSKGKLEPVNNLNVSWSMMANATPGWPVLYLSTPSQYYFTMPSFESTHGGEDTRKQQDLSHIENLKPYSTFWIKNIEAGGGTEYVLICKDNKSPFVKLTKGEYLELLEKALPIYYEAEKKKIHEANPGNQRQIDYAIKSLDEKTERFRVGIKKNKEKYKNRLDEIALTNAQPSFYDVELGRDAFSSGYLTDTESTSGRVPVYKIDSAMAANCKKDKPQWILVSWWWSPNQPTEKHMHESIINNFNFKYVYDFFFDPQKVKGQPYKPLRSPLYSEGIVKQQPSDASIKNDADKSIFFYEDFSNTPVGKKPIGWKCPVDIEGGTAVVSTLDGLDGNWVVMNGAYTITPTQLKKPFPQDFTLSYELVAAQHFTWGAKGLILQLSKESAQRKIESSLKLRLRPGFDGRGGEATFETNPPSSSGYSSTTKWFEVPGFSNNKKNNHITVTIVKEGELLKVFIDKDKIAEYEKAFPATHLFNDISFDSGSSGENNKYYISKIKITKN